MKIDIDNFVCKYAFDIDDGESIEIFKNDKVVARYYGLEFPDLDKEVEVMEFSKVIRNFLKINSL